jgi:hypothetical protein
MFCNWRRRMCRRKFLQYYCFCFSNIDYVLTFFTVDRINYIWCSAVYFLIDLNNSSESCFQFSPKTFKKYDKPVSIHFNSKDHSIDDFRYAGIEISRKVTQYIDRPVNHCLLKCVTLNIYTFKQSVAKIFDGTTVFVSCKT